MSGVEWSGVESYSSPIREREEKGRKGRGGEKRTDTYPPVVQRIGSIKLD